MKYIYFSITVVLFEYGKLLAAKLIVQSKVRTPAHYDYIKIIDEWFLLGAIQKVTGLGGRGVKQNSDKV